jgi:hypothetical protein
MQASRRLYTRRPKHVIGDLMVAPGDAADLGNRSKERDED